MRDGSCVPLCRADLLTVVSDNHPETDPFRDSLPIPAGKPHFADQNAYSEQHVRTRISSA